MEDDESSAVNILGMTRPSLVSAFACQCHFVFPGAWIISVCCEHLHLSSFCELSGPGECDHWWRSARYLMMNTVLGCRWGWHVMRLDVLDVHGPVEARWNE